jgi:hypothetical protein
MATTLDNVVSQSVQSEPKSPPSTGGGATMNLLWLLGQANGIVSQWWSRQRDNDLRKFVTDSDHVSGAMYAMISKMTTIPFRVIPRDKSIISHAKISENFTDMIINGAQFGEGWMSFYSRWLNDLLSQDNGAFAEIIGFGDKGGQIQGPPIGIAHLDSSRCTRTGNAEYPVVYTDISGRVTKLHSSRVMFSSQLPSSRSEMYGVGFCAVSRCINTAKTLVDILTYKQEKLGSRPARALLLTGGGLDPEDVTMAQNMSENVNSAGGFTRYSKTMVIGNRTIPDPKLSIVELSGVPDGYDEKESMIIGMAVISLGFGMDARELFPAMESGATKADAIISHIKQRGKGPGQIITDTENLFNSKVLPSFLKSYFDFQDDSQDRQEAEIRNIRAQARQRDMQVGVTDTRIEREKMLSAGELTEEQFEYLELEDGRMIDGTPVEYLFFSTDTYINSVLSTVNQSNWEKAVEDALVVVMNSRDVEKIKKSRMCVSAIQYKFGDKSPQGKQQAMIDEQMAMQNALGANTPVDQTPKTPGKDTSYQTDKFGRTLPKNPVNAQDESSNYQQAN